MDATNRTKASTTPIVLCSADLDSVDGHLTTDRELRQPETDCACADERVVTSPPRYEDTTLVSATPALHIDDLPGSYKLVSSPRSQAGVVVLNQSAWTIFTQFHQPAPLNSVAAMGGSAREVAKRMVELGILQPAGQPLVTERALSETLTVWLHVTNECNLRCDYCFVSKTPDEMDFERGKQAIDAVARSAVRNGFRRIKLKYAGGEATLNFPLVVALHQYAGDLAARHGLKLEGIVLSNGVAIGSRVIRALRASGIRLMISLDGIGEHHDTHRRFANGHGSFSRVARALDRLAQHGIKPSISITLSRRNLSGLAATVEYLLERELPFTINFYRENDCSASFSDLAYHDEQIIASMREAFAVIARRLPPYSLLGALLDRARLDTPHDYPCGVGRSYMVIDHHGGVAKCHMEIERTVTSVVVEDPLRLIREDREGVQNPAVAEKAGCRECAWRYWCAGGCPLLTYRVTGRYDVKSPNCRIYQTLFPEVVRLEGLRLLKYSGLAGG